MLLTEDEAYKRWCPHARVVYLGESDPDQTGGGEIAAAHNRVFPHGDGIDAVLPRFDGGTYAGCVGSDCMAWRWAEPAEKKERRQCDTCGGSGEVNEEACCDCESEGSRLYSFPAPARRGYCGAFGKPEA